MKIIWISISVIIAGTIGYFIYQHYKNQTVAGVNSSNAGNGGNSVANTQPVTYLPGGISVNGTSAVNVPHSSVTIVMEPAPTNTARA